MIFIEKVYAIKPHTKKTQSRQKKVQKTLIFSFCYFYPSYFLTLDVRGEQNNFLRPRSLLIIENLYSLEEVRLR